MMSELSESSVFIVVLRVTLFLLVGWMGVLMLRFRAPSIAIVVARCLFLATAVGPFFILWGWSLPVALLPHAKTTASVDRMPEFIAPHQPASPINNDIRETPIHVTELSPVQTGLETAAPPIPVASGERREVENTSANLSGNGQTAAVVPSASRLAVARLVFLAAWALGSVFLLLRFASRAIRTAAVIRRSDDCSESQLQTLSAVSDRLQLQTSHCLRVSSEIAGPCTVGWRRSIVLLPSSWTIDNTLSETQLKMILAHELTHARGKDALWDAIAQITRAIWWFHPLVSAIVRTHRLACEHLSDAAASLIIGNTESYRRQLAKWALAIRDIDAGNLRSRRTDTTLVSLSMAEKPLMLRRLNWLKAGRLHESASVRRRFSAAIAIVTIAVICLAIEPTRRLIAAPQQNEISTQETPKESSNKQSEVEPASVPEAHVLTINPEAMGYSQDDRPILDWKRLVTVACTVLNEGGQAIPDAKIQVSSLTDQNGRTGIFILEGGTLSDQRGGFRIKLPSGTRSLRIRVHADGYADLSENIRKLADRIEIQMKSGRLVRVRATDAENKLLAMAMPIVEGSNVYGREFKNIENGIHASPVLALQRRWMWVADGSDPAKPILFSDLIDLDDATLIDDAGTSQVVLRPGIRLQGILGPEVPRPVKDGFVHVLVHDGENHRIEQPNGQGLAWHEYTQVNPDGTFVFESLPRDTHAQIFAICEGWQSANPSKESVLQYFKQHDAGTDKRARETMERYNSNPQLFHLAAAQNPSEITVPCRQTTSLNVRVIDPVGNPIPGANVSMSPNLAFFGDLVIPGVQYWTNDMIRAQGVILFGADNPFAKFASKSFLDVKTDDSGVARIRNLPNLSDSFEVDAEGYVMSAYPTTEAEKPGRFGLTGDMIPGKVTKRTITMEQDLKPVARELVVVDPNGKPLQGIKLTIVAIATQSDSPDWQQWSVRRFGAPSVKVTNPDGLVKLLHPQILPDQNSADDPIELLAIRLEGRITPKRSVNKTIVIPAKPDGRGIRVTAIEPTELENSQGRWRSAEAQYADIFSGGSASTQEIAATLIERNDLLSLRQLLAANDYDDLIPVEMLPDSNWSELRNRSPTEKIATDSGDRIVALASVRYQGLAADTNSNEQELKEAAFIFDEEGLITGVLGGGDTDGDNLSFTNLGGTFNFFISVSGFEAHEPYEYATRWYKVDEPDSPALTIYHQANSSSNGPFQGTKFPLAEYSFLGFGLNGVKLEANAAGVNSLGAQVPRSIAWDRPKKKFFGEPTQTYEDRAIYRVIAEESARFEPVSSKKDEITVIGGRRDFQNWHLWQVVIPPGDSRTARLELRDASGKTTRVIDESTLDPGAHKMQLMFWDASSDDEADNDESKKSLQADRDKASDLTVIVDAKDFRKESRRYKVPHFAVDESPTVLGQSSYFASKPPLKLLEKNNADQTQRLVWIVE